MSGDLSDTPGAEASEHQETREETPEEIVARETAKSPRRAMCAAVLTLQSVALGLTTPVMITVAGVPRTTALVVGLGLAVLALLTAGLLRKSWGYHIGSAIQVASIGLGFVIDLMFVVGGVFALLWFGAVYLGRKIEREKSAAWHAWLAEQQA
ncbi:DUF4233 domain-containing protein [Nocardioides gilvus]|uniref:DUF4233 domain-containing protein n=1 Tax=Nocardioides gilvus TaxID=1735589 RepID=UPI001EF5E3D4|nr:DUF4233 domain-containing protein [Nocardioides gilvus]